MIRAHRPFELRFGRTRVLREALHDLCYFALNGTDHRTHGEQNAGIAEYVRWRHSRAEPKVRFASESPIRQ